jgi:hypothetical protein
MVTPTAVAKFLSSATFSSPAWSVIVAKATTQTATTAKATTAAFSPS